MKNFADVLNQEQRYPNIYFFFEQDEDGQYIHYDNYDYFNDDSLKEYVIDKALELYSEDELDDFYVTYKARKADLKESLSSFYVNQSNEMDFNSYTFVTNMPALPSDFYQKSVHKWSDSSFSGNYNCEPVDETTEVKQNKESIQMDLKDKLKNLDLAA